MILRRITQHVKDQNWTAIAIDFVIVVIGVGVALMGQQWLADRQQARDLERAETLIRTDLFINYIWAKERLSIQPCRTEAYKALGERLLEQGDRWTGMPRARTDDNITNVLPTVLRSPSRPWGSTTLNAELTRGTLNGMDDDRRDRLIRLFEQTKKAEGVQDGIQILQARLKVLANDIPISPEDRLRYYDVLAELDDRSAMLEIMSGQNIAAIEELGIHFPEDRRLDALGDAAWLTEQGKEIYGDCYLPVTFDVLERAGDEEASE